MRFVVAVLLTAALFVAGWLAMRSISVESSGEKVQITIDRGLLRQAHRDLEQTGRQTVGKVGAALQRAGQQSDGDEAAQAKQ